MFELLTNEHCREEMGRAARENARRFDWTIIAQQLLAAYHDLLKLPAYQSTSSPPAFFKTN
jgi:glycosyltransferase involved in cell wall biosynthesis